MKMSDAFDTDDFNIMHQAEIVDTSKYAYIEHNEIQIEGEAHINHAVRNHDRMTDEIAELCEMSDTGKSVRASAVMEFVNMIRGAYEAGFVDNNPTTYDVYRSAQVHVKDMYGVDTDNWDDELSRESRRNNHDRMMEEIAELKGALREARGALSACSIQESRNDGSENRMKIKSLDKQVYEIDSLLAKLNQEGEE